MTNALHSGQRGVFTIITAAASVSLVLLLALVIDVSRMLIIKSELQTMADACSLAAVAELNSRPNNLATVEQAKVNGAIAAKFSKKNFQAEAADPPTFIITVPTNNPLSTIAKTATCTVVSNNNFFYLLNIFDYQLGDIKAVSRAGLKATTKACVLPIALLKLSPGDYSSTTPPSTVRNNLRFAALSDDRTIDYAIKIQTFGLCNISTKYRDIFVDMASNLNALSALDNRRSIPIVTSNANRLFLPVPVVAPIVTLDNNSPNARIEKWVCLEMKNSNTDIVYVGLVNSSSTPCITMGITGTNAVGPLAPVLTK